MEAGNTPVLVHNCGVSVTKSENSITISHADSGSGVIADLDEKGNLTLMMDNNPKLGSPLRGKKMFADVMDHFGDRVKSIQGYWKYGDNLGAFNDAVANGKSLGSAAKGTWTGRRAAEYGFARVKVIQADEGLDGFTAVSAIFRR